MNWLAHVPLSFFVRLLGAVMVGGAIYISSNSGLRWGWFSTPSVVLGLLADPGLLFHRQWAQVPGMLFFGWWFASGFMILLAGAHPIQGLPLVTAALCSLPVLWKWSDDVRISKV